MSATHTPPRRLVRPTDDRVVAGVASGIANHFNIDPVLVRIAFVVLTITGGAGILVYIAAWLLTPEGDPTVAQSHGRYSDHATSGGHRGHHRRGAAFWIAIVLFVLAGLAIADALGGSSVLWPIILIGAGVALWRSGDVRDLHDRRDVEAAVDVATAEPGVTTEDVVTDAPEQPLDEAFPPPASSPAVVALPRERSVLGRLTIGTVMIALAIISFIDVADIATVPWQIYGGVATAIVGLGLVVGAWFGRARWLALIGVLILVPAMLVGAFADEIGVDLGAGIGERTYSASSIAQVDELYTLGMGHLVIDLRDVQIPAGQTVETAFDLDIGQAEIFVPEDVTVVIDTEVRYGSSVVLGRTTDGRSVETDLRDAGEPDAGVLHVSGEVGLGELRIVRR